MKKNKMMRIASILLVVTLLSTCVISGTFAKYVTRAEGKDQARVAKWGVLITMEGDSVFSSTYAAEDPDYIAAKGKVSVEAWKDYHYFTADELDRVVAPGTKLEGLKATVYGKPEVAARYTLDVSNLKDIVLPKGTYTDYTKLVSKDFDLPTGEYDDEGNAVTKTTTKLGYFDTFTLDNDYYPVNWDLVISSPTQSYRLSEELQAAFSANPELYNQAVAMGLNPDGCSLMATLMILDKVKNGNNGAGYVNIVDQALANIVQGGRNFQLEITKENDVPVGLTMSYDFDPNKEMHYEFAIDWEWAFENGAKIEDAGSIEIYEYDAADTLLGNLIASELDQTPLKTANDYLAEIDPSQATLTLTDTSKASLEIGADFVASAVQID